MRDKDLTVQMTCACIQIVGKLYTNCTVNGNPSDWLHQAMHLLRFYFEFDGFLTTSLECMKLTPVL